MTKYKKDVITIFKKRNKEVFLVNTIKNELVTYEEFFKKTLGLISYFKSLNLTQGNKILINRKNSEEYLIVFLAACLGGFSILPVDPEISNERLEVIKKTIKFDLIIYSSRLISIIYLIIHHKYFFLSFCFRTATV